MVLGTTKNIYCTKTDLTNNAWDIWLNKLQHEFEEHVSVENIKSDVEGENGRRHTCK